MPCVVPDIDRRLPMREPGAHARRLLRVAAEVVDRHGYASAKPGAAFADAGLAGPEEQRRERFAHDMLRHALHPPCVPTPECGVGRRAIGQFEQGGDGDVRVTRLELMRGLREELADGL